MFDLLDLVVSDARRAAWVTVLTRGEGSNGQWNAEEVAKISDRLHTPVQGHPRLPQHLIIAKVVTEADVLKAMGGAGQAFTVQSFQGYSNPALPWPIESFL